VLIQLACKFIIDPIRFPQRLIVELDIGGGFSDGHPECGLFSGTNDGFEHREEMGQKIHGTPIDAESPWVQWYNICAPNRSQPHRRHGYHYVAIGWHDGVYASYPIPTEIILEDSAGSWSVIIGRAHGVTVLLNDYAPWDQVQL